MKTFHPMVLQGERFDWVKAQQTHRNLLALGRHEEAAACVDPGVFFCPCCGQAMWREGERVACTRCGARLKLDSKDVEVVTRGDPEKIPPKLRVGMRIRLKKGHNWGEQHVFGRNVGTVRKERAAPGSITGPTWHVEFDKVKPHAGNLFGLFGPFLDPDLFVEVVTNADLPSV